ncbi:hypothetical protein RB653_010063 [Dictyostelium firmibasis]|uniref:CHCH domain-containing protein n=1 Tax=Dictyostelium firmibasis TaxID=79012 RepID=A0AAN7TKA0_9MYCE
MSNEKISNLLKSSFVSGELDNKVQWIWSKNENNQSKVEKLSKTCSDQLELLYQCELKNGSGHKDCASFQLQYTNCLSNNICPKESVLKDIFCFGDNNSNKGYSHNYRTRSPDLDYQNFIKLPPSLLTQMDDKEKSDYCREFSNQLSACINKSLSKIWDSDYQ